jgi:nitroimidazol reductase NimA-like FMN-containing flavoprotein (pyridoxamine 5'-phosphate oxidase superfamily)
MTPARQPGLTVMTVGHIDPRYGDASATAPDWTDVEQRLVDAPLYWLVTVRADGRPHAVPLCGVWHDGGFAFVTGEREQKMRNLEANPHVAVTAGPLGAAGWASGKDVVVEGVATRITDPDALRVLAEEWERKYDGDWRWEVRDGRFVELSDSGGNADPDHPDEEHGGLVFRVPPAKVMVFGDDHGQTTYRF